MSTIAYFSKLFEGIDLKAPAKNDLWQILEKELTPLKPTRDELQFVYTAYEISYAGHINAPPRASGEAYIIHPVRSAIRMIHQQRYLSIKDIRSIAEELLHDCFEDAEIGGTSPVLMLSEVLVRLDQETTYNVLCVTKQKVRNETNEEYFTRLSRVDTWRPIYIKFWDRYDNIVTLESMPLENQRNKIQETEQWFTLLGDRLQLLIEREVASRRLKKNFLKLPNDVHNSLMDAVCKEKKRLNL